MHAAAAAAAAAAATAAATAAAAALQITLPARELQANAQRCTYHLSQTHTGSYMRSISLTRRTRCYHWHFRRARRRAWLRGSGGESDRSSVHEGNETPSRVADWGGGAHARSTTKQKTGSNVTDWHLLAGRLWAWSGGRRRGVRGGCGWGAGRGTGDSWR